MNTNNISQPNAVKWLSEGLQEYAQQSIKGDIQLIAKKLQYADQTVREYLKGEIKDLSTGKKVLAELKSLILKRENEIKRMVA